MNLDAVSRKDLQELEKTTKELLAVLRKVKLPNPPLIKLLEELEAQTEAIRRERFDEANPEYQGY